MDTNKIISAVAPWIGTALGGPLGGLAVSAVADALGLSEKTESAIATALQGASSEQILALKNADNDFALRMQSLGFENQQALEKIASDDRANARARELSAGDKTPRNLAYLLIGGALVVVLGVLFGGVRVESTLAGAVIGYLFNEAGAASTYFFGEGRRKFGAAGGALPEK